MDFIPCLRHPESKISLIHIRRNKTQLLCELCLEQDFVSEINQLMKFPISINKILEQPEQILKNFNLGKNMTEFLLGSKNKDQINDKMKDIEKYINQILQQIQEQLQEFKEHVSILIEFREKLRNDSIQIINLEELKEVLLQLKQEGNIINPDAFQQILEKLNNYFKNILCNESQQLKQKINIVLDKGSKLVQNLPYVNDKLNQIIQSLNSIKKFQTDIVGSIIPNYSVNQNSIIPKNRELQNFCPLQSYLIKEKFKNKLTQLIHDRTKKKRGTKDGLNGKAFRDKVNWKSNLLLIFKSKSKYVFGFFSPCKWKYTKDWIKDETNQSFIFSETHDEIYPLIESQNQYAIMFSDRAGPWIGYNGNIGIYDDFQGGQCFLGSTYQWEKSQNQQTDYLYGSATPNIIESEIFEIILK